MRQVHRWVWISCFTRGHSSQFLTCSFLWYTQYRNCTLNSLVVTRSQCKKEFDELIACNKYYHYDYSRKCKDIRQSLLECAVKNQAGEFGKWAIWYHFGRMATLALTTSSQDIELLLLASRVCSNTLVQNFYEWSHSVGINTTNKEVTTRLD